MKSIQDQVAQLLAWVKEGRKADSLGKDRFPVFADDPLGPFQTQLSSYLKQVARQQVFWKIKPENWPAGRALLASALEEKVQALRALMVRLLFWNEGEPEREAESQRNVLTFDELMRLVKANLR